ncbi:MAG: DNA-3-methyladenine glycosylase [Flavobacteriales bacterium]|nr:DNA-3-methyladenine glycosylase [Flavobacteriales bacterium]
MLPPNFYLDASTLDIARQLLGKVIRTEREGQVTSGIINETEAYLGIEDRAAHSYNDRRTARTETMYARGGIAYVYLCYGIHEMFNVVVQEEGVPHAILVRSVIPMEGLDIIHRRRAMTRSKGLSDGPGKLCQALAIDRRMDGITLDSPELSLWEEGHRVPQDEIQVGPRIGVDYAGEDALLPYRFLWQPSQ